MKGNGDSSSTLLLLKILGTVIPIIVASVVAHYSTKGFLESAISLNKQRIEYIEKDILRRASDRKKVISEILRNFNAHVSSGINGIRHPEGIIIRIRDIERRLTELKEVTDRLTRAIEKSKESQR